MQKKKLIKTYNKHNSFFETKSKYNSSLKETLERIKKIKTKIDKKYYNKNKSVFDNLFDDIFENKKAKKEIRFKLTQNVIDEISAIIDDKDLAKYLVHRYRYEIFPTLKKLDQYPPYLQIEPSSICNYRCVFCFETDKSFTKKANGYMGQMKIDLFKEIIDTVENKVEFISLASRGEPLACSDIDKMLEYTEGKFLNLKINTNASLLNEKKCHSILSGGVKTVVFSADAAKEPLYSKLRVNGNLERVLKNIKLFKKIKETQYPKKKIITRVSGVKYSKDQDINSMENLWGELVDQVYFVNYNTWESIYETKPNKLLDPCSDLWRRMFIWWDGKINPCDSDYKSKLSTGDFFNGNLSKMWLSTNYQNLRNSHLNKKRQSISPCNSCIVL